MMTTKQIKVGALIRMTVNRETYTFKVRKLKDGIVSVSRPGFGKGRWSIPINDVRRDADRVSG